MRATLRSGNALSGKSARDEILEPRLGAPAPAPGRGRQPVNFQPTPHPQPRRSAPPAVPFSPPPSACRGRPTICLRTVPPPYFNSLRARARASPPETSKFVVFARKTEGGDVGRGRILRNPIAGIMHFHFRYGRLSSSSSSSSSSMQQQKWMGWNMGGNKGASEGGTEEVARSHATRERLH